MKSRIGFFIIKPEEKGEKHGKENNSEERKC